MSPNGPADVARSPVAGLDGGREELPRDEVGEEDESDGDGGMKSSIGVAEFLRLHDATSARDAVAADAPGDVVALDVAAWVSMVQGEAFGADLVDSDSLSCSELFDGDETC